MTLVRPLSQVRWMALTDKERARSRCLCLVLAPLKPPCCVFLAAKLAASTSQHNSSKSNTQHYSHIQLVSASLSLRIWLSYLIMLPWPSGLSQSTVPPARQTIRTYTSSQLPTLNFSLQLSRRHSQAGKIEISIRRVICLGGGYAERRKTRLGPRIQGWFQGVSARLGWGLSRRGSRRVLWSKCWLGSRGRNGDCLDLGPLACPMLVFVLVRRKTASLAKVQLLTSLNTSKAPTQPCTT